jgi:hypothetical protein
MKARGGCAALLGMKARGSCAALLGMKMPVGCAALLRVKVTGAITFGFMPGSARRRDHPRLHAE